MALDVLHTYLLKPGLWELTGVYHDQKENNFQQKGQLVVNHEIDLWTIAAQVAIIGEQKQTVETLYEVMPLKEGESFTDWKSNTSGPEPIFGLFVMVDDAIMMPWQSKSGAYWGQEVLFKVTDSEYRSRGFAFLKDQKVSSWSSELYFQS